MSLLVTFHKTWCTMVVKVSGRGSGLPESHDHLMNLQYDKYKTLPTVITNNSTLSKWHLYWVLLLFILLYQYLSISWPHHSPFHVLHPHVTRLNGFVQFDWSLSEYHNDHVLQREAERTTSVSCSPWFRVAVMGLDPDCGLTVTHGRVLFLVSGGTLVLEPH